MRFFIKLLKKAITRKKLDDTSLYENENWKKKFPQPFLIGVITQILYNLTIFIRINKDEGTYFDLYVAVIMINFFTMFLMLCLGRLKLKPTQTIWIECPGVVNILSSNCLILLVLLSRSDICFGFLVFSTYALSTYCSTKLSKFNCLKFIQSFVIACFWILLNLSLLGWGNVSTYFMFLVFAMGIMIMIFLWINFKNEADSNVYFELLIKMLSQSPYGIILLNSSNEIVFLNKKLIAYFNKNTSNTHSNSEILKDISELEFKSFVKVPHSPSSPSPTWKHHNYSMKPFLSSTKQENKKVSLKLLETFDLLDNSPSNSLTFYTTVMERGKMESLFSECAQEGLMIEEEKMGSLFSNNFFPDERHFEMKISYISVEPHRNKYKYILFNDVTEAQVISDSLAENSFKLNMLNSFSHELNTPLNSARSVVDCAIEDVTVPYWIKEKYLIYSQSSLFLLNSLILDILDFLKIETNRVNFTIEKFSVRVLIENVNQLLSLKLKEKGVDFLVEDKCEDCPMITSDRGRVRRVILNLIQNAIKNTYSGTLKINISTYYSEVEKANLCKIQIMTKGWPSISQDGFSEALSRSNCFLDQEKEFGLQISRLLISALKPYNVCGFHIESNSFGITYELLFYCSFDQQSLDDSGKSSSGKSDNGLTLSPSNRSFEEGELALCPRILLRRSELNIDEIRETSNPEVLIVDDEPFNILSLEMLLKKFGVVSHKAQNGQIALDFMKKYAESKDREENKIKCIFMDLNMPIMGGIESTMKLRAMMKDGEIPTLPIIGYSANDSKDDISAAHRSGMKGFISKPLSFVKLKKALEQMKIRFDD